MRGTAVARPGMSRLHRLRLRYGWGYENSDFQWYGPAGVGGGRDGSSFLGYAWYRYKVRDALNSKWARSVTEDKWIFYRLVDGFGLAAPRTLGLYDRTYGTTWDLARPLRSLADLLAEVDRLRPDGLVVKPNGGMQGRNLVVLSSIDHSTGAAMTRAGEETTLERALAGVDLSVGLGGYPGYVVQECLRNHPVIEEMAPYAANTLRVQTLLSPSGEVHILGAILRLSRQGSVVDNVSQGGISVRVDPVTGVTGTGAAKKQSERLTTHPDSGVDFTGRQIPYWDDVLSLVRRGAGFFTGLRGIGWDIAVTPEGPVAVEANNNWDLQILQVHTDGFLADPAFRRLMEENGVPLPTGNVLEGLLGRWVWPVKARVGK